MAAQQVRRAATERTAPLRKKSGRLAEASIRLAKAEEAEQQASDFRAELERLTQVIVGRDSEIGRLGEDRQRLEAELAEARSSANVSRIATLRTDLDATTEAMEGLGEQQVPVRARVALIGDGTVTGPGLLLDTLTAAEEHRTAVTVALDELYPDRPGAGHRRALAEYFGALGNKARVAEERKAAGQPRTVVMG